MLIERFLWLFGRQQPEPPRSAREEWERHRPLSAAEQEQRARMRRDSLERFQNWYSLTASENATEAHTAEQSPERPTEPESDEKPPHGDL